MPKSRSRSPKRRRSSKTHVHIVMGRGLSKSKLAAIKRIVHRRRSPKRKSR